MSVIGKMSFASRNDDTRDAHDRRVGPRDVDCR